MKRILVIVICLLMAVAATGATQDQEIDLFLFAEITGDQWATDVIYEHLVENFSRRQLFAPAALNDSDMQVVVRGGQQVHLGEIIYYLITTTVVFHRPELVYYTDVTAWYVTYNEGGLQWAASQVYNFTLGLMDYAVQDSGLPIVPESNDITTFDQTL